MWVLIVMLFAYGVGGWYPALTTAVFADKAACHTAGEALKATKDASVTYICTPQKTP